MTIKTLFTLLLLTPLVSYADLCKTTTPINPEPYRAEMGTRKVTFLAVELSNNHCWVMNESGLNQRHSPYSSFKIPHALIALETGAVSSVDEAIVWDTKKYPPNDFWPETWKQSHTLASAFKHSAVWYYQALVPRIKPADYKKWLATFHYGNQAFTPGSNEFWLNNELQISPAEQVEFIVCLLRKRCGVQVKHFAAFESAAMQETQNGLTLFAKSGAGSVDPDNNAGAFEGWYVGYIKNANGKPIAAFATYMEAENFQAIKDYRKQLSLTLLSGVRMWSDL